MRESRRNQELKRALADRFGLDEKTAGAALVAIIEAVQDRLPRGARVALMSWLPECWPMLGTGGPTTTPAVRGVSALAARVEGTGVPRARAVEFVAESVRLLGERCGTPLAEAMRRKVPELAEAEQAFALGARAAAR